MGKAWAQPEAHLPASPVCPGSRQCLGSPKQDGPWITQLCGHWACERLDQVKWVNTGLVPSSEVICGAEREHFQAH